MFKSQIVQGISNWSNLGVAPFIRNKPFIWYGKLRSGLLRNTAHPNSTFLGHIYHKQSFTNPDVNQTSLSKHVLELKSRGLEPSVSWKLADRGKVFSPVTGNCQLCTKEAYYIIFKPEMAELNSRREIFLPAGTRNQPYYSSQQTKNENPQGLSDYHLLAYLLLFI